MIPFLVFCLLFLGYLIYQNKNIQTTYIHIPSGFDKKVVFLSDIHNDLFGKDNRRLIEQIKKEKPSQIFITGDLIDSRRTNYLRAYDLTKQLVEMCEVVYVIGNHETRKKDLKEFLSNIRRIGVTVLFNETKEYDDYEIIGALDVGIYDAKNIEIQKKGLKSFLDTLKPKEKYRILLSHRPHFFDIYTSYDFDLVLCGHAHGGQMRLPFIKGLYAPQQGICPKYTEGFYEKGKTRMLVHRGLGNSLFPLRIFDNPEIIVLQFIR